MAAGWAVTGPKGLDVKTVSADEIGAMVNWLAGGAENPTLILPTEEWADERVLIEFKGCAGYAKCRVVRVKITVVGDA